MMDVGASRKSVAVCCASGVSDESGSITVGVIETWDDVDGRPLEDANGNATPDLVAAADAASFLSAEGFGFMRGQEFLILLALVQLPGFGLSAYGVERWGRKPTLVGFLLLSAAGCLCFQHFGWDMLDDLRAAGFSRARACAYWSPRFGYLGGEQLQFVAER